MKSVPVLTVLFLVNIYGSYAQDNPLYGTKAFCNPVSIETGLQESPSATNKSVILSTTVTNTDFVSAGVGGMRNNGTGQITISGINGTVKRALLYWHGVTNSTTNVGNSFTLNSTTVTGVNIGVSDNNCWGFNNSQAYRADVTNLVQSIGNGTYSLSGFGALTPNGASLIVFFDDGNAANNRDVVIFEGNDSNISFAGIPGNPDAPADPAGWDVLLSGINYFTPGTVNIQLHVADGQAALDDAVRINNVQLVALGAVFQGNTVPGPVVGASGGNLWDIRTFNVTSFLTPNSVNSLNLTTGVYDDCLGLIAALIDLPAGTSPRYYSKATGDLHNVLTWGRNPDGSGANPPDFTAADGKVFELANRSGNYNLTGNWTVGGTLVNNSGNVLQIGNYTLAIADLSGAGLLGGTTNSNLIVNQPSSGNTSITFAAGINNLNNLGIASSNTTVLTSPLNIYGVLTAQSGTLNTGNTLVLKSTAANTARVAPVTGTITGTVTVERYIPARRAWRVMSAPVGGSQSINSAWQEGATTSSANPNPSPGYGTHITEGSAANGWDHNPLTAMISVKRYVSATDTWNPLANTNATAVNADAYLLFVRGNRSIALGYDTVRPNNTTLRASGPLKTGNQTFPVSATGFTAIPNPFASPINFATLTRTNVQNNFYLWDPKLGGEFGVGGYVLLSFNGSTYDVIPASVSPESQYIQSGQGFLVRSTGSAGSLVIKESDKSATAATDVFRVGGGSGGRIGNGTPFAEVPISTTTAGLRINLQAVNKDNSISLLDEVFASYGKSFSDKVDNMDAQKVANVEENLAIIRENQTLMVDRSQSLDESDVIGLKLWNTAAKTYVFEFNPVALNAAVSKAYLVDRYLKTTIPIDLHKVSQVYFSVNADVASSDPNRFSVTFRAGADAQTSKMGITTYPNPLNGKTIQLLFSNQPQGTYKVELVNGVGQLVHSAQIQHGGGSAVQQLQLSSKPAAGVYLLKIANKTVKRTIKVVVN